MKIALIAATGQIGRQIARRALDRGHSVTAIVRNRDNLPTELDGAHIAVASLDDPNALAAILRGHDVLASAYGPRAADARTIVDAARTLVAVAREASVERLVVVGGAGSLEVAPGQQLVDMPDFPAAYKPHALAHRDALAVYRAATDLRWTFLAPAAEIGPGPRRGRYRTQAKSLLVDGGHSRISYGDFADAFVDEIEQSRYVREIATAAY